MKKTTSSSTFIHPSSVVSPEASLEEGVQVGPFCVIGPKVRIGRGTKLSSHVHIEGDTEIGQRCTVYPGAVLGAPAQARLSKPVNSGLTIGDDNEIREYVTMHCSMKDGGRTRVGDRNLIMASAHIAHDCVVGSDATLANLATLGGHVQVEDGAVVGGMCGIHQFVRIGRLAMVGAYSKLSMDAVPFSLVDGRPASFCGPNAVGLKRAGFSPQRRADVRRALKMLLAGGRAFSTVLPSMKKEFKGNADVEEILSFIAASKRGVIRAGAQPAEGDE